ncbi:MAG: caspase family protein [Pirellulales bacterium]
MSRIGFVALCFLAVLPPSWCHSQTPRIRPSGATKPIGKGRFCAILIGVDHYQDSKITSLQFCSRDVRTLGSVLSQKCGYDDRDVYLFATDEPARPTRQRILDRVQDVLDRAMPDDVVVVFFSGHGWLDPKGKAYLITEDAQLANLGDSALPVSLLRELLERSRARDKCLLLDCCHAGGKAAQAFGAAPEEVGRVLQDSSSLLTLASCKAGERSWEWPERRQGLFTAFLAEGLAGEADTSNDQRISTLELAAYVTAKVAAQSRRLNVEQNPVLIVTGNNEVPQFDLALTPNRAIREYALPLDRDLIGKLPPGWEGDPSLAVMQAPVGVCIYPQTPGHLALSRKGLLLESGSYLEWTVYLGGWGAETQLTLEGEGGADAESFQVKRPIGNVGCTAALNGLTPKMMGDFQDFAHRCRVEIGDELIKFHVDGQLIHTKRISADAKYAEISVRLYTPDARHYAALQNSSLLGLRFGKIGNR